MESVNEALKLIASAKEQIEICSDALEDQCLHLQKAKVLLTSAIDKLAIRST